MTFTRPPPRLRDSETKKQLSNNIVYHICTQTLGQKCDGTAIRSEISTGSSFDVVILLQVLLLYCILLAERRRRMIFNHRFGRSTATGKRRVLYTRRQNATPTHTHTHLHNDMYVMCIVDDILVFFFLNTVIGITYIHSIFSSGRYIKNVII